MSNAMRDRRLMAPPVGILTVALLLVVALAGSRFGQTAAQDATPAAGSNECLAASADTATMDEATPEAAPAGTPVDDAAADAAVAAANAYVECYNASADTELQISNLTPDIDSAVTYDDGRTSIGVAYMLGEYQYVAATWHMVEAADGLQVAEERLGGLAPEGDTVIISASVAGDNEPIAFDQRSEIFESEVTTIHIVNTAATTSNTYYLYSVPAAEGGATPVAAEAMATPTGEEAMATGELIGMITVPAGGEADFQFIGLPVATYVLVNPNVEGSTATLLVSSLGV